MGSEIFTKIAEKYPFITFCTYAGNEYVGIVQNRDDAVTTIYDFGSIQDLETKKRFLELANVWWWESNRSIPINIFLAKEIQIFRYAIKNFATKDVRIMFGPCTSLNDIITKRIKRKSITLVRRST